MLCTDLTITPAQIIAWFVRCWQMEAGAPWAAFEEAQRHLGIETQRQWTDTAIGRTTPILLGLFSLVTLLSHPHVIEQSGPIRQAAWYHKRAPHVAGLAGLLWATGWGTSAQAVTRRILATADPIAEATGIEWQTGRIDAAKAVIVPPPGRGQPPPGATGTLVPASGQPVARAHAPPNGQAGAATSRPALPPSRR